MKKTGYTFDEIKKKLVHYCVYQDRCHQEVEAKMREFLLIPEAKDDIFMYLIQENYLNEERFVRSYIRGKFYIKHWGRNKIRNHLKFKTISEKLIEKCFDEIDESDYRATVHRIIGKCYEKYKDLDAYQCKAKTIKYLMVTGFEYDMILSILEQIEM